MLFQSGDFVNFLVNTKAVSFGEFVLKSGKKSNVFFNIGKLVYGEELLKLGEFFANFIVSNSLQSVDAIFGPAYKGINISIATSIALYEKYKLSIPFVYNRKIEKAHAEGGKFVGYDLANVKSLLILDDVFTNDGTKHDVIKLLSSFKQLVIKAIVIGIDRQEVDDSGESYLSIFNQKTGIDVLALTTKNEVLTHKSFV
jgi:orotate phosphoribosyltransferase